MMAKLKFLAPLLMAGAAATAIAAAPVAAADAIAAAGVSSITIAASQDWGPNGGSGCTADGTCGHGGPNGGGGCTADGVCGHGGPRGGGGCVPGVGCFEWNQ
jgi:hypothetical protein